MPFKLFIGFTFFHKILSLRVFFKANQGLVFGAPKEYRPAVLKLQQFYGFVTWGEGVWAEAGSEIMVKSNVINVVINSENRISGLKASTPKGDMVIDCDLIIDASGFNSSIARKLGIVNEWRRYGIGAEYECYCENVDSETLVFMVGREYSDAGYAWIFPLSKKRIRIGVGIGRPESNADPLEKLNSIIEKKLKPLDKIGKVQPIEFHSGIIPNEGIRKSTVSDGLILVGDSAGQANPLVLEGIRYAIEFGRLAGEVGAKSLAQNSKRESLLEYEKIWKNKVESKINSALKVQSKWIRLDDKKWDKEIEILKDMSQEEFLDFIKAEFTASKMLKLALNHPKLAARQLFNIVLRH